MPPAPVGRPRDDIDAALAYLEQTPDGFAIFNADRARNRYVQIARVAGPPAALFGEAVSDRFLAPADGLDEVRLGRLAELGWQAPSPGAPQFGENHHQAWERWKGIHRAAVVDTLLATLVDVYGMDPVGSLEVAFEGQAGVTDHQDAAPDLTWMAPIGCGLVVLSVLAGFVLAALLVLAGVVAVDGDSEASFLLAASGVAALGVSWLVWSSLDVALLRARWSWGAAEPVLLATWILLPAAVVVFLIAIPVGRALAGPIALVAAIGAIAQLAWDARPGTRQKAEAASAAPKQRARPSTGAAASTGRERPRSRRRLGSGVAMTVLVAWAALGLVGIWLREVPTGRPALIAFGAVTIAILGSFLLVALLGRRPLRLPWPWRVGGASMLAAGVAFGGIPIALALDGDGGTVDAIGSMVFALLGSGLVVIGAALAWTGSYPGGLRHLQEPERALMGTTAGRRVAGLASIGAGGWLLGLGIGPIVGPIVADLLGQG